jgi:hypothetical protein
MPAGAYSRSGIITIPTQLNLIFIFKIKKKFSQKIVEIDGLAAARPRRLVVERLRELPQRPRDVIIEKWLPYTQQKRRVIHERSSQNNAPSQRNLVIEWDAPEVKVTQVCRDLGVVDMDPAEYIRLYGNELKCQVPECTCVELRRPPEPVKVVEAAPPPRWRCCDPTQRVFTKEAPPPVQQVEVEAPPPPSPVVVVKAPPQLKTAPPPQPESESEAEEEPERDPFAEIVRKYQINNEYAIRMRQLRNFNVVFLVDDSSSMNSELDDSPLNKQDTKATRWLEAEFFTSISVEIANLFDKDGIDVYFLNHQPPLRNVTNLDDFQAQFKSIKANGYTPLTKALLKIFSDNAQAVKQKPLLVVILTDGEPTDERGYKDIDNFKKCLKDRSPIDRIFISIVACTDQKESVKYLNGLDTKVKNLDVVDDFRSERAEMRKRQGASYDFSFGDYVVKSMIGPIDASVDKADEKDKKDKSDDKDIKKDKSDVKINKDKSDDKKKKDKSGDKKGNCSII